MNFSPKNPDDTKELSWHCSITDLLCWESVRGLGCLLTTHTDGRGQDWGLSEINTGKPLFWSLFLFGFREPRHVNTCPPTLESPWL